MRMDFQLFINTLSENFSLNPCMSHGKEKGHVEGVSNVSCLAVGRLVSMINVSVRTRFMEYLL